jgi:hypothetical protein
MRLMTCVALLLFALGAPSAMAETCNAPPGTSGIDQYCEALPGAGGNGGSNHHDGGKGGGGHKPDRVSPKTTDTLRQHGADGAAVLSLANSVDSPAVPAAQTETKPAPAKHHKSKSHKSEQQPQTTTRQPTKPSPGPISAAPASNPVSAVGDSFSSSLGGGFIALLAGIAVVLAVLAWLGRRRPPEGGEKPEAA